MHTRCVRLWIENAAQTEINRYPDLKEGTKLTDLYLSLPFLQTRLRCAVGFTVSDGSSPNAAVDHSMLSQSKCKLAHLLLLANDLMISTVWIQLQYKVFYTCKHIFVLFQCKFCSHNQSWTHIQLNKGFLLFLRVIRSRVLKAAAFNSCFLLLSSSLDR